MNGISCAPLEIGKVYLTLIRDSTFTDMLPRLCPRIGLVGNGGSLCLQGGAGMKVVNVDALETFDSWPQPQSDSSSLYLRNGSYQLMEEDHATLAVRHQWHL